MINLTQTIVLSCFIFMLLGCDFFKSTQKKEYQTYSEILSNDGVNSWLPESFPQHSENIIIYTHIESNTLEVYFSLQEEPFTKNRLIHLNGDQLLHLKKINKKIESGWCLYSEHNMWKESRPVWYVVGKFKNENRYLLSYASNVENILCD